MEAQALADASEAEASGGGEWSDWCGEGSEGESGSGSDTQRTGSAVEASGKGKGKGRGEGNGTPRHRTGAAAEDSMRWYRAMCTKYGVTSDPNGSTAPQDSAPSPLLPSPLPPRQQQPQQQQQRVPRGPIDRIGPASPDYSQRYKQFCDVFSGVVCPSNAKGIASGSTALACSGGKSSRAVCAIADCVMEALHAFFAFASATPSPAATATAPARLYRVMRNRPEVYAIVTGALSEVRHQHARVCVCAYCPHLLPHARVRAGGWLGRATS